jgi:hypothetical protein
MAEVCPYCDEVMAEDEYELIPYFGRMCLFLHHKHLHCNFSERYLREEKEWKEKWKEEHQNKTVNGS